MSDKQKALLAIFFVALFGAGNYPIQKIGILTIPPLTFAFIRFFLSSLLLFPFVFNKKRKATKELLSLLPITLFAAVNIILFILGLKLTTATIASLLHAAGPLITGVIAYKLFGEKLTSRSIVGILTGFIGITIVILLPVIEKGGQFSGNFVGNLLIGVGVVCSSAYLVLSKKAQEKHSPFVINNAFIFTTTITLLPLFLFEQIFYPEWWKTVAPSGLSSLMYVVAFGTIVLWLSMQYAVKHGGSVFASMQGYLLPIFAFMLSFILLGERLTAGLIIGGALALFGVFLVTSK